MASATKKSARPLASKARTAEARERRKNSKRLAALSEKEPAVQQLEELVFGHAHATLEDEDVEAPLPQEEEEEEEQAVLLQSDDEAEARLRPPPTKKAAWVDEDDDLEEDVDMKHPFRSYLTRGEAESSMSKEKLRHRMRDQFQKAMGGAPAWAVSGGRKVTKDDEEEEEEEDDDDDLLRRTGNLVGSSDQLSGGILRMKRCPGTNTARPSADALTSLQFHPSAQVALTAGLDCALTLFQVDGKTNGQIQSVHLDRFPVHKARFTREGDAVVATGLKNKMFYVYDMIEGRVMPVQHVRGLQEARVKEFCVCPEGGALMLTGSRGYLHKLTLKTKEVVSSMKMNGEVVDVALSADGSKVFAHSEDGEVYVWDARSNRCLGKFPDDGCVAGTAIAASPDGRYLACGSRSGVVNLYRQEACLNSANPRPLKAFMNLVTPVTALAFNPSSEILAMASRHEDEAVKLVHLAGASVFSNFPIFKRKVLYRTSCMDFSPHGGFFSLANNKGHAPLFRLLHYKSF
ncbi:U3 small nucleolar RNA-associated protein 18 homolog [Stigmatopora argus]